MLLSQVLFALFFLALFFLSYSCLLLYIAFQVTCNMSARQENLTEAMTLIKPSCLVMQYFHMFDPMLDISCITRVALNTSEIWALNSWDVLHVDSCTKAAQPHHHRNASFQYNSFCNYPKRSNPWCKLQVNTINIMTVWTTAYLLSRCRFAAVFISLPLSPSLCSRLST